MSDADHEQQSDRTKRCPYCRSVMPLQAVKCTTCSEFNGYRRFISPISAMLGIAIAIVTVWAAIAPPLYNAFAAKKAIISAGLVRFDAQSKGILFSVGNSGTAPLVVKSGFLGAATRGNPRQVYRRNIMVLVDQQAKASDLVVVPNSIGVFSATVATESGKKLQDQMSEIRDILDGKWSKLFFCYFTVEYIDTDGNLQRVPKSLSCPLVKLWIDQRSGIVDPSLVSAPSHKHRKLWYHFF